MKINKMLKSTITKVDGEKLRKHRKGLDMTQKEFGSRIGLSQDQMSKLERNDDKASSISHIIVNERVFMHQYSEEELQRELNRREVLCSQARKHMDELTNEYVEYGRPIDDDFYKRMKELAGQFQNHHRGVQSFKSYLKTRETEQKRRELENELKVLEIKRVELTNQLSALKA